MKGTLKILRKAAIFIVGTVVILLGIVLLPAPGPGLLVIIAGLFILSLEFDWAKRYLHQARQKLKQAKDKLSSKRVKNKSAKNIDRPSNHKRQSKR